jgi:uncharacterized protein (TIGR03435 family)
MRRGAAAVLLAMGLAAGARTATSQSQPAAPGAVAELGPEFEVATIRPAAPDQKGSGNYVSASGRFEGRNTTLRGLVGFAYNDWQHFSGDEVSGGPKWVNSDRFDVEAKVDSAGMVGWGKLSDQERVERVKPMLRRLLADRFHVKLHVDMQVKDVFALEQVKGGAKLKEVIPPPPTNDEGALQQDIHDSMTQKNPKPLPGSFMMSSDGWVGNSVTMFTLAVEISGNAHLGGPLVDKTGLRGYYDFTMKTSYDKDAPPLLDQIETQLGLKVEERKLPIKVFVIDAAEQPQEN